MFYYKKRIRYKYNLHSDVTYQTDFSIEQDFDNRFLQLTSTGFLTIRKGYSWDGPSGPTIDTKNFMRGSLVHDALYQLMRENVLPQTARKRADEILRDICIDSGMSKFRASYVYFGVRLGGSFAAKPDLLSAP